MSESTGGTNMGIGLLGMVFVLFLALKLCGVIGWSWLWVTAPIWAPLAFAFALLASVLLCYALSLRDKRLSGSLSKHRASSKDHGTQKSPRVRHRMMLDAQNNDRKADKSVCLFESIKELFKGKFK